MRADAEEPGELPHGLRADEVVCRLAVPVDEDALLEARGQEGFEPLPLAPDVARCRRAERSHRGPAAPPLRHGRRALDARPHAVLDHQPARGDQRGDLGVAELAEQAPDVAVDRLGPDPLPRAEVAADQGRVDPRVRGRGVEGDQPALAVTGDADLRLRPRPVLHPVHGGEDLLHLVADDVPAHLVRLAVDPLAVRLVGHRDPRVPGELDPAADEGRDHDAKAVRRQPPGELGSRRDAGGEARDLLRRLVRVGQGDDLAPHLALRLQQQALAVDALQDRPAHLVGPEARRPRPRGPDGRRRRSAPSRRAGAGRRRRGSSGTTPDWPGSTSRRPPGRRGRVSRGSPAPRPTRRPSARRTGGGRRASSPRGRRPRSAAWCPAASPASPRGRERTRAGGRSRRHAPWSGPGRDRFS